MNTIRNLVWGRILSDPLLHIIVLAIAIQATPWDRIQRAVVTAFPQYQAIETTIKD